jgi:hypothetical protein
MFLFPFERAPEVLRSWRGWTETAPEEITTSIRLLHLPPLPELPDFLRGRSVAVIDGAFAGDAAAGAEAVAALRALGPELDTWAMAPAVALSRLHMDPEEPMPYVVHSTVLGPLDDAALDAFAAHAQPGRAAAVRRAAPARGRDGARAGGRRGDRVVRARLPLPQRRAGVRAGDGEAVHAAGERVLAALSAYETGAAYLNFASARSTRQRSSAPARTSACARSAPPSTRTA